MYDAEFQREIINTIQNDQDLQYLLASSEIGQNIKQEINLHATDGRLKML